MDMKQFIQSLMQAAKKGSGSFVGDRGLGIESIGVGAAVAVRDRIKWQPKWKIEKYHGEAKPENLYAVEEFAGNLLLNEGITELLNLLIGDGAATAFSNANAYIGVGDDDTAAAAAQTGLQAAVNKLYKAMDATYPQVVDQTVTFRSTYGNGEAAFAWKSFTVANGNSDAAVNLNRLVEDHGVKASADTWVLSCQITIS